MAGPIPTLDELVDQAKAAGVDEQAVILCLETARSGAAVISRALIGIAGVLPPRYRLLARAMALAALHKAIGLHLDDARIAEAIGFATKEP